MEEKKTTKNNTDGCVRPSIIDPDSGQEIMLKCLHKHGYQAGTGWLICPDCGITMKPASMQLKGDTISTEQEYLCSLLEIGKYVNLMKFNANRTGYDASTALCINDEENVKAAEAVTILRNYINRCMRMRIANDEIPLEPKGSIHPVDDGYGRNKPTSAGPATSEKHGYYPKHNGPMINPNPSHMEPLSPANPDFFRKGPNHNGPMMNPSYPPYMESPFMGSIPSPAGMMSPGGLPHGYFLPDFCKNNTIQPVYTDGDLEYTDIHNVAFQVDKSVIGDNTIFINYTREDDPVLRKKDIKHYQIGIGDSNQVGSRMLIKTTGDKVEDCGMHDKIFMLDKQTYDKLVEAQNK